MFYVWRMNDGRWQVSAFTSAPRSAHGIAHHISGSDTRAEAETKRQDANRIWADVKTAAATLGV